ncbi:MAG TPA: hypothetical protein VHX62_06070 [Solirubrobacteraceae bacterium]|jgi:hypothetical protein|nr:hypothetical protein [Solirubrobacteraceae bacterium]
MALFGKSEEKKAQEAAVQEEIARIKSLPVAEVAAQLLPALGPDGVGSGRSMRVQQLCEYLLRDFPGGGRMQPLQLMGRVNTALAMLENAELVSSVSLQRSPFWSIAPRGEQALADGTLAELIARGDKS